MRRIVTGLVALAALPLMGFGSGQAWNQIKGEWAVDTIENCGHVRSLDFTFEYRRDEQGNIYYPNNQPPSRRDRLATAYINGDAETRANVGRRVQVSGDAQILAVPMRQASLSPFIEFGLMDFDIIDDDTIRERNVDQQTAGLMRALGESPVTLVRCD